MEWVNDNTADAAQLIGDYGIVDAAVAEKALPYCNIVCITGTEMMDKLSGYLSVLCGAGRRRPWAAPCPTTTSTTARNSRHIFRAPGTPGARRFPYGKGGARMKRRTGAVRLWAVIFWLLVWEGASLALAATTGGRMLLLASPVQALGRLMALAGTAAFWQAVAFSSAADPGGLSPAPVCWRWRWRPCPPASGGCGTC